MSDLDLETTVKFIPEKLLIGLRLAETTPRSWLSEEKVEAELATGSSL